MLAFEVALFGTQSAIETVRMKRGVSKKRERGEQEKTVKDETNTEPFAFYSSGGWHIFAQDQSDAMAMKLAQGLITEEEPGTTKKKSEKRIRRSIPNQSEDEVDQFFIVPGKHWPKPAKCSCCKGGKPGNGLLSDDEEE